MMIKINFLYKIKICIEGKKLHRTDPKPSTTSRISQEEKHHKVLIFIQNFKLVLPLNSIHNISKTLAETTISKISLAKSNTTPKRA
jgi:hypothetical protein